MSQLQGLLDGEEVVSELPLLTPHLSTNSHIMTIVTILSHLNLVV